ncbi:MAG: T9SS type A sorting domain-containing protein [Ignavibacteria bacterium]|jgi:hypothetical protein|nr:T9SS type A sorting domain-containing protein [Ignavibacteria bacterium]MDH7528982.1 T9SS type A sorting domain-containing protein [Ignavibacteria bacterium]
MKRILISIFFILILISDQVLFAQSYYTYGWATSTFRRELTKTSTSYPTSSGLSGLSSEITVGRYVLGGTTYYTRSFYQWNITNDLIPDNVIIDTVQIHYEYYMYSDPQGNHPLQANFYNCINDLQDGSQTNLITLWNNSEDPNKRIASYQTGSQGVLEKTYGPGSNMVYFLQSSLQSDKFVLGIQYYYENTYDSVWYIKNSTVKLRIVYRYPDIPVTVDQKLNNTSIDSVGLWNQTLNKFEKFKVPKQFNWSRNTTKALQGSQKIISNQKYNVWKKSGITMTDVKNHHEFFIDTSYNNATLTSQFNSTYSSITIMNNFPEVNGLNPSNDIIHFKDPWLIDYPDPLYGNTLRNRGMDAPFKQRPSPFYPDYTTSYDGDVYKGVFLNQNPTFDPTLPIYSVKADAVQDIQLQQTGRTHKFYFQNWSATPQGSADFQNANALQTGVVFKQDGAVVSANYKGSLLTNQANALSNTSQRKVIRTSNGHLHVFYISMGKLWYEKSVNGVTWYAPKVINYETEVISFSIDSWQNKIYIASHQRDGNDNAILFYMIDENGNLSNIYYPIEIESGVDAKPVIGAYDQNIIMVYKYKDNEPLKYLRLLFNGTYWITLEDNINYSSNISINPSLSIVKSGTNNTAPEQTFIHLIWEDRYNEISSDICYLKIGFMPTDLNANYFYDYVVISKGSGYELCTNGNIVAVDNYLAHIGFIGQRKFYPVENYYVPDESRAVFTSLAHKGVFYSFGDDVQSVSINRCNTRWTFAWTRGNDLPVQYVDSRDIRVIYQLGNLRGVDVHITNGIVPEDMYAFVINTSQLPYPINYRAIYGDIIPEELVVTEDSREGIVSKEGADVYYSIGEIKVGDEKVGFVEIPDTTGLITLENANRYLISKPFMVNDNSGFVYSIKYGVTDSSALKEALTNTDYIKFRIELIDYNTKELLGVFDEVSYNSESVSKYENINCYVNTAGLGERMVQLRLVITNNVDPYYSLSDKFSDANYNLSKKKARKEINYKGLLGEKVYSYELIQNYPNPFNPVTKIRYSVKETKPVMIKLYDIVGREVATLVNEVKDAGEYEIELNAGKFGLSSGVYFYQMKAGDFTSIKKMVVLK